jgi:multidrug efflux system outer membrane protein
VKRVALVAALAACYSMAPTYERPPSPVAAQIAGGQGDAKAADVAVEQFVRDPNLRQILAQVVAQNRSLRRALLDIESARQLYRIQRAGAYPQVGLTAGVVTGTEFLGIPGEETIKFTEYSASVGLASWEIDFFGKIKSQSDAKLHQYFSAVETARAQRTSLIAETAAAYVAIAADRSRLAIARDTMATSKKAMDLTEALVGGGTSNRGDFWQASTVYDQARGDVAALTATIDQDRNALELLTGSKLDEALLPASLPDALDWFAEVPVGMSSSVLLDRPDVLAAEHDLMAANANIGAARAEFFPSITLTASGGLASLTLGKLFTAPTALWTIAPSLNLPLFRAGALSANLAYTKTQKLEFIAAYERTIQSAFREVADALATRATIEEQLAAQAALVDAASKGLELAQARYKAGVDTFLATLVSERALYAAKNSLVATQLAALDNRVTLYRVLGGGVK